jgi:hypothetical protein
LGDNSSRITSIESGAHTFTGIKTFEDDIILESNLRVQGDLLVANTVHMIVSDPIMELGANNLNTGDLGIIMTRHGETGNVAIVYDESQDVLNVGYTLSNAYENTIAMDTANSLTLQVNGALNVGSNIAMNDTASNVIEVSGNVKTDSLFLGNFEVVASQGLSHVTAVSAATNDTVYLNNPTTGLVVDSNVEIGENLTVEGDLEFNGNLTMNTITVQTLFTLDHVVSQGNTTSNTVQFTNPTTSLTATGNVEVGGELSVSGNVEVGTANLFVDTITGNVGIGTVSPGYLLDVHGAANVGTLTTTGRLGLGTATPLTPLHISSTNEITSSPAGSAVSQMRYGSTNSTVLFGVSSTAGHISAYDTSNFSTHRNLCINADGGFVGIGTVNPSAQLTLGASSGSQIAVTGNTRLFSNTHYIIYGSGTTNTFEQVLLQFDTGGTSGTDQSEYAGYVDVEMVAQRTTANYLGPEIFTARLNFILGWNEAQDAWKFTTFVQENKGVSALVTDNFTVFKGVPVFKYKYVDRQLQIYVSFDANYFNGRTSFTARVTSDNPADVSTPGADALMASGTVGTAEVGICYGVGTNAANVGVGTADPGGYKLNVNGAILGTTIRGTQLNINGVGGILSGGGNIAANTGVDTGVSLYAGNSGGSIYLMISANNNSGSQTGTWAYIVRRYHSTTNTWTNSASTVTQLAAMNGMTSPNPGNPTLYRNSSTGRLDFKFPNAGANYKFTAYVI